MNKIKKISSYFLMVINLLIIGLPIIKMLFWFLPVRQPIGNLSRYIPSEEHYIALPELLMQAKVIGFIGSIIALVPILWGLFILKKIFINYQRSEVFNTENALSYKHIGILIMLYGIIAKPVSSMFATLVSTGSIIIELSNTDFAVLFSGGFVIVISLVMYEASTIYNEQKYIV